MNLLDLLREFGADEALVALAEAWVNRADAETPMSDEDLDALLAGLMALADDDEAGVGLLLSAADTADEVRAEQTRRAEVAEQEEAEAAEAIRRLRGEQDDTDTDGDDTDGDDAEDTEGEDTEASDGDEGEGEAEAEAEQAEAEREPVTAATLARSARRQRARSRQPADDVDTTPAARIVLAADVPGRRPGETVASLADVDRALVSRAQMFRRASAVRGREEILVASIEANYPEDRRLTDDPVRNSRLVTEAITQGRQPQALAAAGGLCAPLTPYYGIPVLGDDRRPVRDALVGFQAARGGVTSIAPPVLPDLAGSSIIWTAANDADPGEDGPETKPCLRVVCGDPRETVMHAVPVCLEFGNFMARTFGEMTDAWSTLSLTAQARLAEQTLLNAIKAESTQPTGIPTTVSAVIDTLVALDQAATGMRSRHRLPESFQFRVIAPETWLLHARTNMARALPGGSFQENLTLADAAIRAWFSARNLAVTFTPDLSVMGQQASSVALVEPDTTMEFAIYPEGSFLFLDGGTLDLGVVRDSTLNATNDFQVFAESFEGVHFVGVESLWLEINVCPSGAVSGTLDPVALCASLT